MTACTLFPLLFEAAVPDTLAELMARVEDELTPKIDAGSTAAYWERNILRTICRLLATMLGTSVDRVRIEQIAELTSEDYIRGLGCTFSRASVLVCAQKKLLKYAASYGWTCEAYRRMQAWEPIRDALRAGNGSLGWLGIVEYAHRHKHWPETFSDTVVEEWKLWKKEKGQSLYTIDQEESTFRSKLRNARLQALFPRFDLRARKPTSYQLRLDRMTDELRNQIVGIVHWREKECNVDFRLRASSARSLMTTLLAFCGYCTYVLGICGITSLRQVLTREIIRSFTTWLHDVRGCRWYTVYSTLNRLYHLTQLGHPLFAGSDEEYAWFRPLLKRLPRESKDKLRKRKIARSVPYKVFTQIAREIGKVLQANKHLNPIQRARLYRDYFFCRAIALHPWRRRNWNECRIDPKSRPNLEYRTIPLRVQRNGKLPLWVKRALKEDPAQEFWMCHYVELETKAKKEIWEPLDPKIVKIFLEYRDVHRGIILEGRSDPGTLLINNAGKPMTDSQLGGRLAVLSRHYIGKRLSLHIIRDIIAEHALVCGCKLETVQRKLWHKNRSSTQKYLSGLNASHACVALERHFARRKRRRS